MNPTPATHQAGHCDGRIVLSITAVAYMPAPSRMPPANHTAMRAMSCTPRVGARRGRIVRQQLTESLLLAFAGGILGTLLAVWGLAAVRTILPAEQARLNPGWTRIELSASVLAFTAAVSVITALIVGIVPALVAGSADPQHALSDGGRNVSPSRSPICAICSMR